MSVMLHEIDSKMASLKTSPQKVVTFDPIVRARLIPTSHEYKAAKLHGQLWYTVQELQNIEKDAFLQAASGKCDYDRPEDN
jgi:hypothetical protein